MPHNRRTFTKPICVQLEIKEEHCNASPPSFIIVSCISNTFHTVYGCCGALNLRPFLKRQPGVVLEGLFGAIAVIVRHLDALRDVLFGKQNQVRDSIHQHGLGHEVTIPRVVH